MTDSPKLEDLDPVETREWLESIDSVLRTQGPERAHFLLERLIDHTRRSGAYLPFKPNTAYVNTIPVGAGAGLSRRSRAGAAHRGLHPLERHGDGGAGQPISSEYGGHIVELRLLGHAVRGRLQSLLARPEPQHPGDLVYIQGHSSPGIYARAFWRGG